MQTERAQQSELQRFDSPGLERVEEYTYDELPTTEKRIRLLELRSGTTNGSEIFCNLVEADYGNEFHIPTKPKSDGKDDEGAEKRTNMTGGLGKSEKEESDSRRMNEVRERELRYEALSWCWGNSAEDYAVLIDRSGKTYKKRVRRELALALKYLRKPHATRTLWIDAICIDQNNPHERNQQVQMMSRIYTRAEEVCVWLGEETIESKVAIDFIGREITQLNDFDAICSDKIYTEKWKALMMLMQRDWFSRRWVVQEIALARKARIYCGRDSIPWKEFAVAVELFVEVETATHRLSEVMQKDEKFRHVPGWFEYVSELGASLLVQATGKVFRAERTPLDGNYEDSEDSKKLVQTMRQFNTIDPLDRRSLLSLEYLVTTMFIFNATECRDSIYSMLAIARDANPFAETTAKTEDVSVLTMPMFENFLAEKPFIVDYARPYADVCRDFVEFCILRKEKLDPAQALDILCRPWALAPQKGASIRITKATGKVDQTVTRSRLFERSKPWQKRVDTATEVGKLEQDDRTLAKYWEDANREAPYQGKLERFLSGFAGSSAKGARKGPYSQADYDLDLPSWVARASKAPFKIYPHPGMHISKTGRANADPLVGSPQDGHRNYSAAQTEPIDSLKLRFRKRPVMGHYSLYVRGFELDEVEEVRDASQGGDIPQSWLDLGGWTEPYSDDPPAEFWRTIVADRGRDNRNPPYYYARACKESVRRGGIASGRVATSDLINNERNSIIAEFCRRVHAVIWGRSLFRTKKGRLGLATGVQKGDKICILYGCTVPVVLQCFTKKENDLEDEERDDRFQVFKKYMRRLEKRCVQKAEYRKRAQRTSGWESEVKASTEKVNEILSADAEKRRTKPVEDTKREKEKEHRDFYYTFKGESYVHGLMDGDALREKFYSDIPVRVFELR